MIDLGAYFTRIGYDGPRDADLPTLRDIVALHAACFPFENLDPLLGRPVRLDAHALQSKMLGGRRGGYCFEQNTLLKLVLEAIGFAVTGLAARVLWMSAADAPPTPRTHMILRVEVEDTDMIVDVGFGGHMLAAPYLVVADIEQVSPSATLRLQSAEGEFTLQLRVASGWRNAYRFTLEPLFPIDFEVANWFTASHPNSRFRNNLILERLTPRGRLSLLNRRLTRRFADGRVEEATLGGVGEFGRVLSEDFALDAPADAAEILAALPAE